MGGGLLSLSLSLSRCSHFLASLWAKFKGLFTHFITISSYLVANFSYFIVVLIHLFAYKRHFLGHFVFLKFLNAVFVRFCALFVILSVAKNPKNLRYALFMDTSLALSMINLGKSLNLIVCHAFTLSNLAMMDIFTHQKHFFAQILGTKFTFYSFLWIATLALLARNDGEFCHFERSDPTGCKVQAAAKKSTKIKRKLAILGHFACAQYDKFGLLLKNNGYFHSNFKAKIQIFHSKFKAFYKFNSFYIFISNFKPYARFFHIFTPNFRSVQTDKFQHKEKKWQMKTPSLIILSI